MDSNNEPIIRVENVTKSFGQVKALGGVSLSVERGQIMALLGPNGAGKTTLIRILTTLLSPDSGRATVAGWDVIKDAVKLRAEIGLSGQYAAIDENLSGFENLELFARLYHMSFKAAKARASELLLQFGLSDAGRRQVKTYSGGMRRRLDLAASLVGNPKILFLDEPTTGLDPKSRIDLWGEIEKLVRGGMTLLLTTQYMEEADRLADTIVVIDRGQIIAKGTARELKSRVGGEVLELHVASGDNIKLAAQMLARLGREAPKVNPDLGQITLPVLGGAKILADAIRSLDTVGVGIEDIVLRHPTMDDVFLALTGHETEGKK